MSNVLRFDPQSRQSSRREARATKRTSAILRTQKAAERETARALGVADVTGARVLQYADLILRVEAANGGRLTAAARNALMDGVCEYHDYGYQTGTVDGQIVAARRAIR